MAITTRKPDVFDNLTEGIKRLTDSNAWKDWLTMQSRFHHYSFGNVLLIASQCPDATRVAGFNTWRQLGRFVRKGEKAIWILAPIKRKVGSSDDTPVEPGENVRVVTGFRPAAIFDLSQTDGEDLPEIADRLHGDDPGQAYDRLVAVAHSLGFTVEEDYLDNGINGYCKPSERSICIEVRNDPAQQVKTLAHEIAHAMLHGDGFIASREAAELEAESVAFIVCSGVDIASDSYSFGYVATWVGGGDEALAALKASGTRIQRTAADILDRLEAASNGGLSDAA